MQLFQFPEILYNYLIFPIEDNDTSPSSLKASFENQPL
jgi:hypothetical protein